MTNFKKILFISIIFFIVFSFSLIFINLNELPSISKIHAVVSQQQLDQTASILSSIQSIINKLKIDIQLLFGREVKAQADITTGLVGHWKFDEGAGTTAADSSGNGNTGTLTNGPTWSTGKIGGALSLDGVDDYVDILGGNISFSSATSVITLSAWIKTSTIIDASIFGFRDSTNALPVLDIQLGEDGIDNTNTGKISMLVRDDNGDGLSHIHGTQDLRDNLWHFVVATIDSSKNMKIYVDGAQQASGSHTMIVGITANTKRFGSESRNSTIDLMNGQIDDVRIYNRALTQTEVTELYNLGGGTPPPIDTTPPTLSVGSPSGTLPSGITQTTLSVEATDASSPVSCKYSQTSGTAYLSMTGTLSTANGTTFTATVTGLTNGTSYNYYVRCSDSLSNVNTTDYAISFSVSNPAPADTTPPSIPTGLIAIVISSSQINLSWTASTDNVGVIGYKIYRCAGAACAPTTQIVTSATNSYSDTGLTASTAYTYAVSAYDAAGNVSPQSISVSSTTQFLSSNQELANLGDNTWTKINPVSTSRYIPTSVGQFWVPPSPLVNQSSPVGRSYSGVHYGNGKIIYFGGGHGSYAGNDVEIYDIANNIWTQSYVPEVCYGGDPNWSVCQYIYGGNGAAAVTPLGRPYTEHTYEQFRWDSITGRFYAQLWTGTWTYNPTIKIWTHLSGLGVAGNTYSPTAGTQMTHLMDYDPIYGHWQVIITGSGGTPPNDSTISKGVYTMDSLNKWIQRSTFSNLPADVSNNAAVYSVYVPDLQLHIVKSFADTGGGLHHWWKYNAVTDAWTEITGVPANALTMMDFDYDQQNKLIIGVNKMLNPVQVWTYNITTNIWTQITQGNSLPVYQSESAAATVASPVFRYDPTNNVFVFMNVPNVGGGGTGGDAVETWAYRYKKTSAVTDAIIPSVPASFQTTAISSSQINLSWIASTDNVGVIGYKIYRCSGSGCIPTTQIVTSATNSYSNTGLTASTAYTYAVSAYDAAGNESGKSTNASATTQAAPFLSGLSIPLTIQEPAGIPRTNELITSGIPLPQGTQTTNWSLWDGGVEVPLQATKLQGRTPWILLDFQTSVPANGIKTLTLKDIASTKSPSKPISITEDASQIIIDNKIIKVKLSKTNFNLFEEVWLDKNNNQLFDVNEQIITPQSDNIQIIDSTTNQTFSGKGTPTKIIWEYQGPIRSTLRVDGRYTNGPAEFIAYTTRLTFYADRSDVKVEHILRNSYQSNERHVKVKSATVKVGTGVIQSRAVKSKSHYWVNVDSVGTSFELIPTTMHISGVNENVDVDQNGGMLLPDLTHFGLTLVTDFSEGLTSADQTNRTSATRSPLFAMAPSSWYSEYGELSTSKFSTLDDEKQAYKNFGWTWNSTQVPWDTHKPDYTVYWWPDVHGETESDDLWQNLIMYLRTGSRGYWDRTKGWAWYFKHRYPYRTDGFEYAWNSNFENPRVSRPLILIPLTTNDQAYLNNDVNTGKVDIYWGADHLWGWGLIDYYYMTGDTDALDGAVDLIEVSQRIYGWRQPGVYSIGESVRGGSRNLLLSGRVWEATQDFKWRNLMDNIAQLFLQSPDWDVRGSYLWSNGAKPKTVSPVHFGFSSLAFARYYKLTGNTQIRDRMIQMANFAKAYALHPTWQYSGSPTAMDYPILGNVWYGQFDDGNLAAFAPSQTVSWIDSLVRGYRLTGDSSLLDGAKYYWDRGSKSVYGNPTIRTAGDNAVGRFMNDRFLSGGGVGGGGGIFYPENGDLPNAHLLFYDYAHLGSSSDTTPPTIPTNSTATAVSSSHIDLSWVASTDNVGVTGYKIYRCAGSTCAPTVQIATSATNSYLDTGLTPSTAYTYAVSAYDSANNESAKSSSVSAATQSLAPQCSDSLDNDSDGKIDYPLDPDCSSLTDNNESDTTPPQISSVISTTLASTTARINWQTNEPGTSQVEYGFTTQYGASTTLSTTLTTSHSVLLSNLSPDNTIYNYRVRSKDSSNNESISTNNTFITPGLTDTVPPAPTTNLKAENITQTSVDLVTWTAAGDDDNQGTASSYDIRYATGELSENTWNNSGVIRATGEPTPKPAGSLMSYTLVGLTPNTTYKAALKTLDEVSNQSLISNIITFTTLKAETAPSPSPTPTPSPSPSPSPTPTPSPGGGGGGGGGLVSDTTPPAQPKNFKAISADKQIILQWKNPPDLDFVRIIIIRKENNLPTSKEDGAIIYEGTNQEFTDINLDNNKTYYYAIYAYDKTSNYSTLNTIAAKPEAGKISIPLERTIEPTIPFPNGSLLKTTDSDKIYFIVNNKKRWIVNPEVFISYGFTPNSQITVKKEILNQYPEEKEISKPSSKEGTLVRAKNDFKVYIIKPPFKRHIFNPAIFNMYKHFDWNSIREIDQDTLDSYLTSDLYRAENDPKVFSLEEIDEAKGIARKRWLDMTPEDFVLAGYNWNQIFIVNPQERDYYQTGTSIMNIR